MYLYICVCVSVCVSVCVHTEVTPWVFAPFASTPHSRTSATAVSERPWNAAQCSGKNPSEFAKLAPADPSSLKSFTTCAVSPACVLM